MSENKAEFPSFSEIINYIWNLYKTKFTKLVKLSLYSYISSAAMIAIVVILGILIAIPIVLIRNNILTITLGALAVVVFIVLCIILGTWITAVSIKGTSEIETGKLNLKELLRITKSSIGRLWVTGILGTLIVFTGYTLFIIPGIIFSIWFSLSSWVVIFEGVGGIEALARSREYLRGYALKTTLYSIGFSLILGLLYIPTIALKDSDLSGVARLYSLIIQFLTAPASLLFSYYIYQWLKKRKPEIVKEGSKSNKTLYRVAAVTGILLPIVVIFAIIKLFTVFQALDLLPFDQNQQQNPIQEPQFNQDIDTGMI